MSLGDVWLDVSGVSGVVRRSGGEGIPTVLIPGCGSDHRVFDALLDALSGRDVLVVCLPGRSGVPGPAPATVAESASYVRRLLDALGMPRVVIGGHSYGGAISIEFALANPERVAGLVLIDTGAKLKAHPDILTGAEAAAKQDPVFEANLADWRACHVFDRLQEVSEIRVPAIAIVGTDDVLTPLRYAQYLADRISGCQLVTIAGADHYAPVTHPVEVGAAIERFLASVA